MNKILRYSLVALMAMVMGNVYADDVTDVMTWESLGLDGSGSSYNEFSNIKLTSKAVYTAQASSGGGKYIQLRTNNNNSGIVATGSGGNLKSVTITFNEKTTDRAVEVYGKNEAYANAADLYGDAKGTLLGTIAANAESKTLTVEGEYTFVGLKSANAAIYVDKIEVTWTSGGGGGSVAVWKADDLTFDPDTKKCNEMVEEPCTNENIFIVSKDTKIYPAGTHDGGAVDVVPSDGTPLTLTSFVLNGTAGKVTMKAVSTPNHNDVEEKPACGWERAGSGTSGLNTNKCDVKFEYYVKPKSGNPSMLYGAYTEYKDDGVNTNNRVKEDFWNPELNKMPVKGLYYEFTSSTDGELVIAILVWRPGNKLYFFDKETFTQFPTSALSIEGYVNNNTVVWGNNAEAFSTIPMTENHDYQVEGIPSSKIFGYMKLNVKANKTYVLLSSNSQPGIYGFYLNEDPTSVETIKTNKVWNADAPIYNLSGQKVDKSYKGIVIQNGRKFVNK